MEEGTPDSDIVSIEPDLAGAVFAVHLASQMLDKAREDFSRKDYSGALEESRNAMRMASSAIMLKNGHLTGSLDSTIAYLSSSYPGRFPLRSWYVAETTTIAKGGGLYGALIKAIGRTTRNLEQEASDAINAADRFLDAIRMEMGQ
ncbi:hypothetical protein H0O00_02410 [Candidatus Micrarchaeota archaeon]|nr:hypothetical protein [Candidatus Micrarchaeota archaeon]